MGKSGVRERKHKAIKVCLKYISIDIGKYIGIGTGNMQRKLLIYKW